MQLGHVFGFGVVGACLKGLLILRWFLTDFYLEINRLISHGSEYNIAVYVLESRLISMDSATQIPISEFEASRWHNSRVCVWYFQVCKCQSCLGPTGQILDLGK